MLSIFATHTVSTKESYESPYGVCGQVYEIWASYNDSTGKYKQLEKMHEAGVDWFRSDYPWSYIQENSADDFNVGAFDALNNYMAPYNMHFFPLVLYKPKWVDTSNKDLALSQWKNFTNRLFSHFQNIEYYEISSEPDWRGVCTGEEYGKLMVAAYDEMKSVNNSMKVVYAGIGGTNHDYFTQSMTADRAPQSFDIMSIHTYRVSLVHFDRIKDFIEEIQWYPKYMKENYGRDIDIWLTEMGYASPKQNWPEYIRWMLNVSSNILFDGKKPKNIAYFMDTRFRYQTGSHQPTPILKETLEFAVQQEVYRVGFDTIKNLSVSEYPLLFLPFGEQFPGDAREDIVDYVRRGGTVVFNEGYPGTYDYTIVDGEYKPSGRNNYQYLEQNLRIHTIADWFDYANIPYYTNSYPYENLSLYETDGKKSMPWPTFGPLSYSYDMKGCRYFTQAALKEGDEFIPLVEGNGEASGKKNYSSAAIIKIRSDGMKGNVIVSSLYFDYHSNRVTERDQAAMIPQVHLAAFYAGVKKMFWYEFRDDDTTGNNAYNAESTFGMVNMNLSEKMGFKAYQTMVRARPADSVQDTELPYENGEYVAFHWKRGDGLDGWAFWTFYPLKYYINVKSGTINESFGMYGDNIKLKHGDCITLTNDVIYIIGPTSIEMSETPPPPAPETPPPAQETSPAQETQSPDDNSKDDNSGVVIGCSVAAGVIAIAIIAAVIFIIYRKRADARESSSDAKNNNI